MEEGRLFGTYYPKILCLWNQFYRPSSCYPRHKNPRRHIFSIVAIFPHSNETNIVPAGWYENIFRFRVQLHCMNLHTGFRTSKNGPRGHVALVCPIKNQNVLGSTIPHSQYIVYRIHGHVSS